MRADAPAEARPKPEANAGARGAAAGSLAPPALRQNQEQNPALAGQSLGVARYLGWVTLVLLLILSTVLSVYLGNAARETLLTKQQNFASLLADNLNDQIYRRFTRPSIALFGRIALRNPAQYRQLDQVIQSIIAGLHVQDLRIFAHDHTITYSTNEKELGVNNQASPSVDKAGSGIEPVFDLDATMPYWQAFFHFSLEPGTYRLRTTYPLHIENRLSSSEAEGPVMGVLEFSQDITDDVLDAIRFQQLILIVTLWSCGVLFSILIFFVRRAERALAARMAEEQRLLQELHQHEKLAGMGRVVASIAHEIRNPLGIICSSAELLLKRSAAGADPMTSRILQAIYDEGRRLSRTVSDFLDYARPRRPDKIAVDVNAVISQALAFLGPELSARDIGVVRAGILDTPLQAFGDKDLLYRAFYNIMGNAMQAMVGAGILTITLARREGPEPKVELVFQDSGPGFPKDNLAQLLDPFFTTKDDGTGLGLPIVNTIITSHGGTLSLENAPDGGALVRVILPAAP